MSDLKTTIGSILKSECFDGKWYFEFDKKTDTSDKRIKVVVEGIATFTNAPCSNQIIASAELTSEDVDQLVSWLARVDSEMKK